MTKEIRALYRPGPILDPKTKAERKNPRPLVVSFRKQNLKSVVLSHAKNLKGNELWKGVSVCEDWTKMQIHYRKSNDVNAARLVQQRNAALTAEEKRLGFKWALTGPQGRTRAIKIQEESVGQVFDEETINDTFHGFNGNNSTIIAGQMQMISDDYVQYATTS